MGQHEPSEFSDLIVLVDPGLRGDGDLQGVMPGWDALIDHLKTLGRHWPAEGHLHVRLTNCEE